MLYQKNFSSNFDTYDRHTCVKNKTSGYNFKHTLYKIFIKKTSQKQKIKKVNKKTEKETKKRILGIAKCKRKKLERKRKKRKKESN